MSFLKEQPASATVYAVENSLLLVLARTKLDAKLERDPLFAARLYRSIAVVISRRLKRTGDALGDMLSNRSTVTLSVANRWKEISTHIDAFKDLMQQADTAAIQNFDTVPKELAEKVETSFGSFLQFLNTQIGDNSADHVSVRDALGVQVKREILPYLLLTRTAERFYSKPRGYAGDFMTIEMIYKNQPQGTGRIGALLD